MCRSSLRLHLLRLLSVCSALLAHLNLRICSTLRLYIRRLCLNSRLDRSLRLHHTLHICIMLDALRSGSLRICISPSLRLMVLLSALLNARLRLGCLLRHLRLSLLLLLYVLLHQFRRYRAAVLAHLLLHAHQLCHHFL